MVTGSGWCVLVAGGPWSSATFEVSTTALSVSTPTLPAPVSIALADIVALDQIDDVPGSVPDGLVVLEFGLASGAVVFARVHEPFVDELVARLQQSRIGTPPEYVPDDPPPPPPGRSGSKAALVAEVAALREYLDGLGFPERRALRADVDSLIAHRTEVLAEVRAATRARREQEIALVRVRRESVLQDAGIYRPRHPAEDDETLRERLEAVHDGIELLVAADDAVSATDDWTVNGSRSEGQKVVLEIARMLLRAYNAEADLLVSTIRPYELDAATDRLEVTRATIQRLGASMEIHISDELHRLRLEELTLAADQRARRDEARRALAAAQEATGGAANLYVLSNPGALGAAVVRIGLTPLADPAAVVDAVDGGQLPFRSDLHSLIPCPDGAVALAALRAELDDRRVNLGDPACSFYRATPAEVRDAIAGLGLDVPWFRVEALAEEWHLSENVRSGHDDDD